MQKQKTNVISKNFLPFFSSGLGCKRDKESQPVDRWSQQTNRVRAISNIFYKNLFDNFKMFVVI